MWRELHVALPNLRFLCRIPSPKTIDSLFALLSTPGQGKMRLGLCTSYPTTELAHYTPAPERQIALNEYFPASDPLGDHPTFFLEWQTTTSKWLDDLGIIPSHLKGPFPYHNPNITLRNHHHMRGFRW